MADENRIAQELYKGFTESKKMHTIYFASKPMVCCWKESVLTGEKADQAITLTRLACGPFSPASSIKETGVPTARASKSPLLRLLR